jgi:hypothetical protein
MSERWVPVEDEDAMSLIGEGVHTGFRKGTEASGSSAAWRAIAAEDSGWGDAVGFAVDGLTSMGYRLCQAAGTPEVWLAHALLEVAPPKLDTGSPERRAWLKLVLTVQMALSEFGADREAFVKAFGSEEET